MKNLTALTHVPARIKRPASLLVFLLSSFFFLFSSGVRASLDWDSARHAANRLGFGATAGQVREIQRLGLKAYVEIQLAADPSAASLPAWAPGFPTLHLGISELQ